MSCSIVSLCGCLGSGANKLFLDLVGRETYRHETCRIKNIDKLMRRFYARPADRAFSLQMHIIKTLAKFASRLRSIARSGIVIVNMDPLQCSIYSRHYFNMGYLTYSELYKLDMYLVKNVKFPEYRQIFVNTHPSICLWTALDSRPEAESVVDLNYVQRLTNLFRDKSERYFLIVDNDASPIAPIVRIVDHLDKIGN